MTRILWLALAALLAVPVPAGAQLAFRPKSGAGVCIGTDGSLNACSPFKDQSGGAYTIVAGDNAFTLEVGAFSYTLPRAGAAGGQLPANWAMLIINRGTGNATIATTTSIFRGGGETTAMILSPGASALVQSDGIDFLTMLFNNHPMIPDPSTNRTIGNFEAELGATVYFTSVNPIAVALDPTAAVGGCVPVIQGDVGQITFSASGSGGRHQADQFTKTATQWAGMTWCVVTNTTGANAQWVGFGRGSQ
jgi:hypothetical protein